MAFDVTEFVPDTSIFDPYLTSHTLPLKAGRSVVRVKICVDHNRNHETLLDFGFLCEIFYGVVVGGRLKMVRFKEVFVNYQVLTWMWPDFLLPSGWISKPTISPRFSHSSK
ncbi:hypothetical protein RRG08_012080 [Elysia crispata]|uniref:Uncharacterized protein n=1 Tax=Elysia crispata TaxID=231223 RepID=A0AAE1BDP7_9GAST|nr:hypothetical protein RRG08_012080 [Elysia crispata]